MKKPINKEQARKQKSYEEYVKQKTPVHNVWKNMFRAFITGGAICLVGQIISNYVSGTGMDKEMTSCYTSMLLVFLSVLLTGLGLYPKIAKWGGAGALVPITGFAKDVYKRQGSSSTVFATSQKYVYQNGEITLAPEEEQDPPAKNWVEAFEGTEDEE